MYLEGLSTLKAFLYRKIIAILHSVFAYLELYDHHFVPTAKVYITFLHWLYAPQPKPDRGKINYWSYIVYYTH